MNKHTAFRLTSTENGKTGTTYTRNSRARIYSYCVVGVVYYRDGTTTEEVMWTSRMDLAQKKSSEHAHGLASARDSPYPEIREIYEGATGETFILDAVL